MNINKKIFNILLEIMILTSVIFITNIIWDYLPINQSASTIYLNNKNNMQLKIETENNIKLLYPTNSNNISNSYVKLNIVNRTDIDKEYALYLVVDNSKINTNYIKVKIDENNEEYLNNLEYTIFDNETYYFIEENLIKNNSEKKSKYYIWLSEETPNTEENRELNFYFKINEF